jgi:ribosome assembly protein 1
MRCGSDVVGPRCPCLQVMTTMAAACRRAVTEAEPRLAEAHYLCAVQAGAEALSGVYAVLGKRRSRILREEVRSTQLSCTVTNGVYMAHYTLS